MCAHAFLIASTRTSEVSNVLPPLIALGRVHSFAAARRLLGLSQPEIGREIARLSGRGAAVRRSTISNWEAGRKPMAPVYRDAVGRLLATWLLEHLHRDDVGIKLTANSPWHVEPMARCACGAWYALRQAHWHTCPKCSGDHRRSV